MAKPPRQFAVQTPGVPVADTASVTTPASADADVAAEAEPAPAPDGAPLSDEVDDEGTVPDAIGAADAGVSGDVVSGAADAADSFLEAPGVSESATPAAARRRSPAGKLSMAEIDALVDGKLPNGDYPHESQIDPALITRPVLTARGWMVPAPAAKG